MEIKRAWKRFEIKKMTNQAQVNINVVEPLVKTTTATTTTLSLDQTNIASKTTTNQLSLRIANNEAVISGINDDISDIESNLADVSNKVDDHDARLDVIESNIPLPTTAEDLWRHSNLTDEYPGSFADSDFLFTSTPTYDSTDEISINEDLTKYNKLIFEFVHYDDHGSTSGLKDKIIYKEFDLKSSTMKNLIESEYFKSSDPTAKIVFSMVIESMYERKKAIRDLGLKFYMDSDDKLICNVSSTDPDGKALVIDYQNTSSVSYSTSNQYLILARIMGIKIIE